MSYSTTLILEKEISSCHRNTTAIAIDNSHSSGKGSSIQCDVVYAVLELQTVTIETDATKRAEKKMLLIIRRKIKMRKNKNKNNKRKNK